MFCPQNTEKRDGKVENEIENNNKENIKTLNTKRSGGKVGKNRLEKAGTKDTKKSEARDVTLVNDDGEHNMAHNEMVEPKEVTSTVENKLVVETMDTTKSETENATLVSDDGVQLRAHKEMVDLKEVNSAGVKENNIENANKIEGEALDTMDCETGNVTLVCDDSQQKKAHKELVEPKRVPNQVDRKKMVGKMLEIMIIAGMENHVYEFKNVIRKQSDGGPIGLTLTGEVADCYMVDWDKKFLDKLKSVGINLIIYLRFKDDITIVTRSLVRGTKWKDGELTLDLNKMKDDMEKSSDLVTMEVIRDIAESVDKMIKFTIDIPENHENGKMPILDVQVKMNKQVENRLDFEFYEKPTRNNKVILKDAAISSSQKRTILTQDCLRRLRNTKIELGKDVQVFHLNNYMLKLKHSGYSAKYRAEILDSSFKAFEKMVEDNRNGVKPLYRSREWNREERNKLKQEKKVNWYKKTGKNKIEYKTVLFVPVTKDGKLAKEMKKREEEINKYSEERIKIVEDGGIKLKNMLVNKNPFTKTKCEQRKCALCQHSSTQSKIPCNTSNVGYRFNCDTCASRGTPMVYEGETARSARIRGAEHLRDLKNKNPKSALFKHKENNHEHEEMKVSMEITSRFKDPLSRQANEAIRISNRGDNGELMNSKTEFNHPPIARIKVDRRKGKSDILTPVPFMK